MITRILYIGVCVLAGSYVFFRGLESPIYYYAGIIGAILAITLGFILENSLHRIPLGVAVGGILGFLGGGLSAAAA